MKPSTVLAETEERMSRPLVERCENWGQCLRLYVPGWNAPAPIGGELSSAESRWRSGFRTVSANPTVDLDVHDAKVIESAVSILPLYQHILLKAWYVRRRSPGACLSDAAKAGDRRRMPFRAFDAELEMAHALLVQALDVPAVIRKVRARELVREILA